MVPTEINYKKSIWYCMISIIFIQIYCKKIINFWYLTELYFTGMLMPHTERDKFMAYENRVHHMFGANLSRLKEKLPDFLLCECKISSLRKKFRCICPSHEDKHPSMVYYPEKQYVKCFSCGFFGDIIAVAGIHWSLTSDAEIIPRLLEYYPDCVVSSQKMASNYLKSRGLTDEIIAWSGAIEQVDSTLGRVVRLPYHQGDYAILRTISGKFFRKPPSVVEPICFPEFLTSGQPIFLVESYICALSVYQCGGYAIPCNGVGYRHLLDALGELRPVFLLSFDKDERGEQAANQFLQDYAAMGGQSYLVDIVDSYKDPNERLMHDAEGLRLAVQRVLQENFISSQSQFSDIGVYLKNQFFTDLDARSHQAQCMTGFSGIDQNLKGLTSGLYILGGIPSVGKTTFLGQMAVNFAQQQYSVLFLSYEQSPFEFMCKTLARQSYLKHKNPFLSSELMRGMYDARVYEMADWYQDQVLDLCVIKVCDTAEQLSERIRQFACEKERPIVIIDYLQFIPGSGSDPRWNNDKALQILSQTMFGLDLILIVVSSFNRSSYLLPVTFESFKESGNVEYYADGLWGLSYSVLSSPVFQKEGQIAEKQMLLARSREQKVRKLNFSCVKSRHGGLFSCSLDYYAAHDYFADTMVAAQKRL